MGLIRLFLAAVVAIDHFRTIALRPTGLDFPEYLKLGMNGGFAVVFFFVISGFLISIGLRYKYSNTRLGTANFYKGRLIRIFSVYWPLVFLFLVFSPTALVHFSEISPPDRFTNLFIIGMDWRIAFSNYPNLTWKPAPYGLNQSWTLSAELTFYLLAPWVLRSTTLSVALLVISAITRFCAVALAGFAETWVYYFLPATFLFFMIGHFAQVIASRWRFVANPRIGCFLLSLCVTALMVPGYAAWDSGRFWVAVLSFAAALPGIFRATKDHRVMNFLGDLSYPLYLTHLLFFTSSGAIAAVVLSLVRSTGHGIGAAILYLGAALIIALLAHVFIENPVSRVLRTLLGIARSRPTAARPHAAVADSA